MPECAAALVWLGKPPASAAPAPASPAVRKKLRRDSILSFTAFITQISHMVVSLFLLDAATVPPRKSARRPAGRSMT